MPIQGYLHNAVRKFYYVIIIQTFIFAHAAAASTVHGTIIVVERDLDSIVIAADSRGTDGNGAKHDETCKIKLIDQHTFLAVAGTINGFGIDAIQEAVNHYVPSLSIEKNAEAWALSIEGKYSAISLEQTQGLIRGLGLTTQTVVRGVFGQMKTKEAVTQLIVVSVNYDSGVLGVRFSHQTKERGAGTITTLGSEPGQLMVADFLRHETAPSLSAWQTAQDKIKNKQLDGTESVAQIFKSATEYAISSNMDQKIGGEAAVLILESGIPRWFNQPNSCK